jgi:hypothetical protein
MVGPWRRRLLGLAVVAAAMAALVSAWVAGALPAARPGPDRGARPARAATLASRLLAVRDQAASWVAQQVSGGAIVACDPAMCAALQAHGIAPANLLVLRPSAPDPLGSDVVLATAAVRSQFGARLSSVYAPTVIASFGARALRIDVRAVAPDGAAAYRASLTADLAARRGAGRQLLRNPRISVPPAARAELVAGRVDSRLLITLAALAAAEPVRITAFTDSGPGAGPGVPLRAMRIAVPPRAGGTPASGGPTGGDLTGGGLAAGDLTGGGSAGARPAGGRPVDSTVARRILAFVRAQRPPYRPQQAGLVPGPPGAPVLSIEFAAPSPVGLLETQPPP